MGTYDVDENIDEYIETLSDDTETVTVAADEPEPETTEPEVTEPEAAEPETEATEEITPETTDKAADEAETADSAEENAAAAEPEAEEVTDGDTTETAPATKVNTIKALSVPSLASPLTAADPAAIKAFILLICDYNADGKVNFKDTLYTSSHLSMASPNSNNVTSENRTLVTAYNMY